MQVLQGVLLIVCLVCGSGVAEDVGKNFAATCDSPAAEVPQAWITMEEPCIKMMKKQVMRELNASLTYFSMGAHFARDSVNLLGFSKIFFESASEEREHAIKLIEYLLMRGELTSGIRRLIDTTAWDVKGRWESGQHALRDALDLEASVTVNIRDIIKVCEDTGTQDAPLENDYHLVDYLSGDFLDEQYKGQRHLAGMASTLNKMEHTHGKLSEFLFDKKILKGEVM